MTTDEQKGRSRVGAKCNLNVGFRVEGGRPAHQPRSVSGTICVRRQMGLSVWWDVYCINEDGLVAVSKGYLTRDVFSAEKMACEI